MKIALVTGSNKGIGLEVIRQLAHLDIQVILSSRNESKGRTAIQKLGNKANIHYHQLDVSDQASVDRMAQYIQDRFGKLHILVNNAGINYDSWHNALNADLKEVQQTIDTNLLGAWRITQAVYPLMEQANYGRIVNVSSGAGAISGMGGGTPGYSVSKAGMNVLTIKLAASIRNPNILVNAVCPGWVRTEMGGSSAPRSVEKGAETIIWAATLPAGGPNGLFFRDKKQIPF